MAGEPADLVELVHTHVDEDAAAAGLKLRGGRLAVPLVAVDAVEFAECAGGDALPEVLQRRDEAAPAGDLEADVVALGDGGGGAGLGGGEAAGFLAQDRQTGGGDCFDQRQVTGRGGGDQHAIEVAGLQHGGDVGIVGQRVVRRRDRIGDGGDTDCLAGGEGSQVGLAHAAGADEAETKRGRIRHWSTLSLRATAKKSATRLLRRARNDTGVGGQGVGVQ